MHVLFLQDNGINESLLICEASAHLKACGHRTSLLLEREERDLRGAVEGLSPDLVVVQASVLAHNWVRRTCRWLKRHFPGLPVVLAGSHVTFYPDLLKFDEVDMLIVGEAEHALVDLLDALAGRRPLETIPNLHVKRARTEHRNEARPLLEDLDALPLPDRGLYFDRYPFMAAFPWKKFTTGRGCLHACAFCYQPLYRRLMRTKGAYVRRKSPQRVVDEVAAVAARWPLKNTHFSDDLFITDVPWLQGFAERYTDAVPVPYSMNTSADFVTPETARLLGQSRCRTAALGIETHDEALRRSILRKDISNETIREAVRLLRAEHVNVVTFNMLAMPHETLASALETLRFNRDLGVSHARIAICFPLPGTAIAQRAARDGVTLYGYDGDIYALPDMTEARPGVFFETAKADERRFVNLYRLYGLGLGHALRLPLVERLLDLPPNPLFSLGDLHRMARERQVYGFSWLEGLRYFLHVGLPDKRTTNFVSLI